jgi:hypothetical protein
MMKWWKRKYFFGWSRIKWLVAEIAKIGSDQPSFFSQKRVQQLLAFIILEWGAIYWLIKKHDTMTTSDFVMWASVQCAVAGYALHQVQKEKKSSELK